MSLTIKVQPHELLDAGAFVSRLAKPIGELPRPEQLVALAVAGAVGPLAVRNLLRAGGFKPAGRSKPASEWYRELMELCGATTEDVVLAK